MLSLPVPAQAHVLLLRSDPEDGAVLKRAPRQAILEFNQPLAQTAYVILTGPKGPVTTGPLQVAAKRLTVALPKATDGHYRLAFRVISAQGHPLTSSISYLVGQEARSANEQSPPKSRANWSTPTGIGVAVLLACLAAWFVVRRRRQAGSAQ